MLITINILDVIEILYYISSNEEGSLERTIHQTLRHIEERKSMYNDIKSQLEAVKSARAADDYTNLVNKFPNIAISSNKIAKVFKETLKNLIILADVKSGKRINVQALSCILTEINGKELVHFLITKLYRKDSNEQIVEHNKFNNLSAHAISTRKDISHITNQIDIKLSKGKFVLIHLDESDYGSGASQILSVIYGKYLNNPNVKFFFWSATNQEAVYSNMASTQQSLIVNIDPGEEYKGASWFLDNGLVSDSEKFVQVYKDETGKMKQNLTLQALELINHLQNSDKTFGIVRFNGSGSKIGGYRYIKSSGLLQEYLEKLGFEVRFIDSDNSFDWGKSSNRSWGNYVLDKKKVILILCQTFSRSTECCFHEHIAFYHDHREEKVNVTTMIQSFGRIFHYDKVGHQIKVACNYDAMLVAANRMSDTDYLRKSPKRTISTRIIDTSLGKKTESHKIYVFSSKEEAEKRVNEILVDNGEPKYDSIVISSCSNWKHNDLADVAMKGHRYGFNSNGRDGNLHRLYYLDAPNPNYQESWDRLLVEHLEWAGKYIYVFTKTITESRDIIPKAFRSMYNK